MDELDDDMKMMVADVQFDRQYAFVGKLFMGIGIAVFIWRCIVVAGGGSFF